MTLYLDTNIVVWLGQGDLKRLTQDAKRLLDAAADLLISPMVILELEYLHELNRVRRGAADILFKLQKEAGLRICDLDFSSIVTAALAEKWTRDPFDRMIVAHAKARGFAALISADQQIAAHYPRTIW